MEVGRQKWIDKAMAQTEKLKALVNSLVTLARMDEDDSPLQFSAFDAGSAVRETAESFVDFAESEGLSLKLDIDDTLSCRRRIRRTPARLHPFGQCRQICCARQ